MNLSCEVIQDLLPLYHDDVCSEESRKIVEQHIATCAACKDVLHGLKEEMAPDKVDAVGPLDAIGKAWKRSTRKALMKGAVIVSLIFVLLVGAFWGLTQWHGVPVESENLRVTQVSQVDDGVIYCELGLWDDADGFGYFEYTLTEDGKLYLTPLRSILTKADRWNDVYFYRDLNNLWGLRGIELGSKATGFYFGTPEDHLVIWEEGMELPPADEATEQEWVEERTRRIEEIDNEMDKLEEKLGELQDEYEATLDKGTE